MCGARRKRRICGLKSWRGLVTGTMCGLVLSASAQTILIGPGVRNGDFNDDTSGTDSRSYTDTPFWQNIGLGTQAGEATRTTVDYDGTRNHVIAIDPNRQAGQGTDYTLARGDVLEVTYVWRDAWNWNDGNDQVAIRLFMTDTDLIGGTPTTFATLLSGLSTANNVYQAASNSVTVTSTEAGRKLFVGIDVALPNDGSGFARLDNFALKVYAAIPEPFVEIANLPATDITGTSVTFNAQLEVSLTNADVLVHWWPDGGATNSTYVGSWTHAGITNISYATNGLSSNTLYYCAFQATNDATNVWASPSESFFTDATPPTPNPITWAAAPAPQTYTKVVMTATSGVDDSGPVEYFFSNTVNGATSGWTTNPTWTDTGLTSGQTYGYRVRARDARGLTGQWSTPVAYAELPGAIPTTIIDYSPALRNGGFESPEGSTTNNWGAGLNVGFVSRQAYNATYPSPGPDYGSFRLVPGSSGTSGALQNTGYVVDSLDRFTLVFDWSSAYAWDLADSISWRLFTTSDDTVGGTVSEIASGAVTGKVGNGDQWSKVQVLTDDGTVVPANAGRQLWIEFLGNNGGGSEWAFVDKVRLSVNSALPQTGTVLLIH